MMLSAYRALRPCAIARAQSVNQLAQFGQVGLAIHHSHCRCATDAAKGEVEQIMLLPLWYQRFWLGGMVSVRSEGRPNSKAGTMPSRLTMAIWGGALSAAVAVQLLPLTAQAQESILPPGFNQPPSNRPAPTPAPTTTLPPRPAPTAPSPSRPRPTPTAGVPASAPSVAGSPATPVPGLGEDGLDLVQAEQVAPRYDLPFGSRRSLRRIGLLTPESGGLAPGAFGNRGRYLVMIMDNVRDPLVSRWGHILLRRAMLSGVDTPRNINGADFAAARASLLLRQGESVAARMLVQAVDVDKASQRMRSVAMQVSLANGDPAGFCPHAPAMAGPDRTWQLARAMCASLVGEPGTATAGIERVRRSADITAIDVKLAEKVVGAGAASSRSARVEWDGVDRLTDWRFGLATSVGVEIPASLWATASPQMRRWAVQMPMIDAERRQSVAAEAAAAGILSARAYVDLVSFGAAQDEPSDAVRDLADAVRGSFVYAELPDRLAAIIGLTTGANPYAGKVLAARAAARIGPTDVSDEEAFQLLAAMFAGGLDNNAMAWTSNIAVGSQGWGLLAVGSPRPLVGVSSDSVDDFNGNDDSVDGLRTRFLAAALIGLGRVDQGDAATLASTYALDLRRETRWTRAITMAAERNEAGTVALLVAVGLQGRDWGGVPPYHLYHITSALRQVGLGAEARMIAAEALSRV